MTYMNPAIRGSNQYRTKYPRFIKKGTALTVLVIVLVTGILLTFCLLAKQTETINNQWRNSINIQPVYAAKPTPIELADPKTQEDMIGVIKKIWRKDWQIGVAIAKCESGLRPDAFNSHNTNGTWDAGLFQINTIHGISKENLMNPYANAGYAYSLFVEQGTGPWYSSKACHGL